MKVRQAIEECGTTAIAEAMGVPISTIHSWKSNDKIPGKPGRPDHQWRVEQFEAAVATVRAAQAMHADGVAPTGKEAPAAAPKRGGRRMAA